jgi:CheY-like chemotaxis protein
MAGDPFILVVDDDADIRLTMRLVLQDEGYRVDEAQNGLEALEALRLRRPALIVLDLSMPVMNGYQFLVKRGGDPAMVSIPVVVLSAADRLDERLAGLQVTECLKKPVDLDHLLAAIAQVATGASG